MLITWGRRGGVAFVGLNQIRVWSGGTGAAGDSTLETAFQVFQSYDMKEAERQ